MAQGQIRWKQGDFIKLGKAVAQFNKKINELQSEENKLYLPEIIEYTEAKENITTRRELNRLINSLRRFQKEGAEDLYTTMAGENITKWERRELGIQAGIASRRIQKELDELNEPLESGYSRAQMGSRRVKELQAELKSLKQIEYKKGYEFKRLYSKIKNKGTSDYEMRKSIVYRENYIEEMKKYSHFDGYDKLMEKLESIKNPIDFFEFVSKNELTQDLTYQSDEFYSQQEFLAYVEVMLSEDQEDVEDAVSLYNELREQNALQNEYFFE